MNERDDDRAEAVRQIATVLLAAYLRLHFPETLQKEAVTVPRIPALM